MLYCTVLLWVEGKVKKEERGVEKWSKKEKEECEKIEKEKRGDRYDREKRKVKKGKGGGKERTGEYSGAEKEQESGDFVSIHNNKTTTTNSRQSLQSQFFMTGFTTSKMMKWWQIKRQ